MVDVSFVPYFAPVLAYLLVAFVAGAVLLKTEVLGKNPWVTVFVSLIIATIFISAAGAIDYVTTVTPWIAVVLISLFFVLLLTGFLGIKTENIKGLRPTVLVIAGLVFLVSAFVLFSSTIAPYIPGDSYVGNEATDLLYSPRVVGAILLIAAAAFVARILVKSK